MKQRNPAAVFFLSLITLGIYSIVWEVKTKNEMNRLGNNIPTAWLLIVPFVSLYWMWKYSEGVDKVTGSKISAVMSFVLLFLLGSIGMAIIQLEFNKLSLNTGISGTTPSTPVNPTFTPPSGEFTQPTAAPIAPVTTPVAVAPVPVAAPIFSQQPPTLPLPPQNPPQI